MRCGFPLRGGSAIAALAAGNANNVPDLAAKQGVIAVSATGMKARHWANANAPRKADALMQEYNSCLAANAGR